MTTKLSGKFIIPVSFMKNTLQCWNSDLGWFFGPKIAKNTESDTGRRHIFGHNLVILAPISKILGSKCIYSTSTIHLNRVHNDKAISLTDIGLRRWLASNFDIWPQKWARKNLYFRKYHFFQWIMSGKHISDHKKLYPRSNSKLPYYSRLLLLSKIFYIER